MFDFLDELYKNDSIIHSHSFEDDYEDSLSSTPVPQTQNKPPSGDIYFLQWKVEKLLMITEALWEYISEREGLSEKDLLEKIKEIDLRDGKLDGKVSKSPPIKCQQCRRTVPRGKTKCMYCGAENERSPFER